VNTNQKGEWKVLSSVQAFRRGKFAQRKRRPARLPEPAPSHYESFI
jgi:hypothetical protein